MSVLVAVGVFGDDSDHMTLADKRYDGSVDVSTGHVDSRAANGDEISQIDAGRLELSSGGRRVDTGQHGALADGVQLGGARGDDDVVRPQVQHAGCGADDDGGAAVYTDDFVAVQGIEDGDQAPGIVTLDGSGRSPAVACTDDDQIGGLSPDGDVSELLPGLGGVERGDRRATNSRVPPHDGRICRVDLAGTHKRRAIYFSDAVTAIACEAECAAMRGVLTVAHDRNGDRIPLDKSQLLPVNRNRHYQILTARPGTVILVSSSGAHAEAGGVEDGLELEAGGAADADDFDLEPGGCGVEQLGGDVPHGE